MEREHLIKLHRTLSNRFREGDLRTLCFTLGVDYDDLPGEGKSDKARELIVYLEHRDRIPELVETGKQLRPDISWDDVLQVTPEIPPGMLDQYLRCIADAYSKVDLRLCLSSTLGMLPIEDLMVAPRLSAPHPLPLASRGKAPDLEQLAEEESVGWTEAISTGKGLLIIGDIGTGKTCLARYICHSMAKGILQSSTSPSPESVIPIFLPLFELDTYLDRYESGLDTTQESPILRFLQAHLQALCNVDFPLAFWSHLLENHRGRLVADGLDEAATPDRRIHIVRLIDRLLSEHLNSQAVLTLRPEAYEPSWFRHDYQVSMLLKLDQTRQEELLSKLSASVQSALGQAQWLRLNASDQVKKLLQAPGLEDRLRTPLFLTIALLHYACLDSSPQVSITGVQERLIELALNGWDTVKTRTTSIPFDGLSLGQSAYTLSEELELLSYWAWDLYRTADGLQVAQEGASIDPLVEWLAETDSSLSKRQARKLVSAMMEMISDRSGLLKMSARSRYAFQSKTDTVLLAARHVADNAEPQKELLSHLLDTEWHRLAYTVSDLLSLRSLDSADDFLGSILENAQPKPEQPYAEQALLAALCLIRVGVGALTIQGEIVQRILEILGDRKQPTSLKTRIDLGRVLGHLGDPRIGEMVLVEKGSFFMGYDFFPEDRPVHKVTLDDFYIDKYPVTNSQFGRFIEEGGYTNPEHWTEQGWSWIQQTNRSCPKYWHDPKYNLPNYPVVGVSWYEAAAYAKRAGKRLPTEAEWEKAARGPRGNEWPWGNEFRSDFVNTAESEEQAGGTTPIGMYPAGASYYVVFDMSGNVSEWTADWYHPYPGSTYEDLHHGERFKVRRGGNWGWDRDYTRCTCRVASPPTADYAVIGFRCCATLRP